MSDTKSIASLMIETSVGEESIGTETSDSFWDNVEMFLISINLKLIQLPRLYISIKSAKNEGISVIIDSGTEGNIIRKEYCLKNNIT